ncbi:hypothetical protein [Aeromonas salmonicida]|uniref:hypothetical protein n=1 Tax=Aeromonas salmonicida TaxID=645 RepID=UPI0031FCB3B0
MSTISELLIQISENTKPDNSAIWVAAISSTSAILGAGIGAFLLYRGTSKQIETQIEIEETKLKVGLITTERLRWLQELRTRSSEFYADLDMNYSLLKRPANLKENLSFQTQGDEISQRVMVQCNNIMLLLNPEKEHQNTLRESCNNAMIFILECVSQRNRGIFKFNDDAYSSIKTVHFDALTKIGSETWQKIKALK